jgi:hypothetical protein
MKKFMLFAVLFGVFASALTSCGGGKKEEAPAVAEVIEEASVDGNGVEGESNQESTSTESNANVIK